MKELRITDFGVLENSSELQTKKIQSVLDMCLDGGGKVIIPKGRFYTAALYIHSNTCLYLEKGAELVGSSNCDDYEVFPIPAGVEMRSDLEMITQYYQRSFEPDAPFWTNYRRAIITAYGEKNISIIGESDSYIDGQHCYDPDGEENYRGPHCIFFSCCENVLFEGYTVQNAGNFMHEANNCKNITMRNVTCLAGSDGIHLHCSKNTLIENCFFKTGDDCIAGINVDGLVVRNCILNTSCDLFRMGGVHVLVENCYCYGPGFYPHRMTVVKGKDNELPRNEGRHDLIFALVYFSSINHPYESSHDFVFRNCIIENAYGLLNYRYGAEVLQTGTHLRDITFENVKLTGLRSACLINAPDDEPVTVNLHNVSVSYSENCGECKIISDRSANVNIHVEN